MSVKSVFEAMGQARMLEDEGNRQIAAALSAGVHVLTRRCRALLSKALRRAPGEHQLP